MLSGTANRSQGAGVRQRQKKQAVTPSHATRHSLEGMPPFLAARVVVTVEEMAGSPDLEAYEKQKAEAEGKLQEALALLAENREVVKFRLEEQQNNPILKQAQRNLEDVQRRLKAAFEHRDEVKKSVEAASGGRGMSLKAIQEKIHRLEEVLMHDPESAVADAVNTSHKPNISAVGLRKTFNKSMIAKRTDAHLLNQIKELKAMERKLLALVGDQGARNTEEDAENKKRSFGQLIDGLKEEENAAWADLKAARSSQSGRKQATDRAMALREVATKDVEVARDGIRAVNAEWSRAVRRFDFLRAQAEVKEDWESGQKTLCAKVTVCGKHFCTNQKGHDGPCEICPLICKVICKCGCSTGEVKCGRESTPVNCALCGEGNGVKEKTFTARSSTILDSTAFEPPTEDWSQPQSAPDKEQNSPSQSLVREVDTPPVIQNAKASPTKAASSLNKSVPQAKKHPSVYREMSLEDVVHELGAQQTIVGEHMIDREGNQVLTLEAAAKAAREAAQKELEERRAARAANPKLPKVQKKKHAASKPEVGRVASKTEKAVASKMPQSVAQISQAVREARRGRMAAQNASKPLWKRAVNNPSIIAATLAALVVMTFLLAFSDKLGLSSLFGSKSKEGNDSQSPFGAAAGPASTNAEVDERDEDSFEESDDWDDETDDTRQEEGAFEQRRQQPVGGRGGW